MYAFVIVALAASAAFARPSAASNTCSGGSQLCCNKVVNHTDPQVTSDHKPSGLLDLVVSHLLQDTYVDCSVLQKCEQSVICCEGSPANRADRYAGDFLSLLNMQCTKTL